MKRLTALTIILCLLMPIVLGGYSNTETADSVITDGSYTVETNGDGEITVYDENGNSRFRAELYIYRWAVTA